MMRNKNKVSSTVAAACTGINPWTFEDVCCMSVHKFRVNCTCLLRHATVYSSRDLDLSLPFCVFHVSRFSRHYGRLQFHRLLSLLASFLPLFPRCCCEIDISRFFSFSFHLSLDLYEHSEIIARCNVQLFQCKLSSKRLIPGLMYSPLFT